VAGTTHYLVAAPKGQRDRWAERFEDLYRSFVQFFSVRGWDLAAPPSPLVGVVCRNQAEFSRIAVAQGNPPPYGVLGYYDVMTNRISLFDMGGQTAGKNGTGSFWAKHPEGRSGKMYLSSFSGNWHENAAVLIHEAAHQTAFNTGVHNRYCLPPTWLVEGLATVFEAPGV